MVGVFLPLPGPPRPASTGTAPGNPGIPPPGVAFLFEGGTRLGGKACGIVSFAIPLCTKCIAWKKYNRSFKQKEFCKKTT